MKTYKASVTIALTGDRIPYKVVEVEAKDSQEAALRAAQAVNEMTRPVVYDITVTHGTGGDTVTSVWRYNFVQDSVW